MAWAAPQTFTSNQLVDENDMNRDVRDNMLETAPAKAATVGHFIRVTGPNAIEEADPTDGAKLDGDKIDIDITLPNITPDSAPSEVDDNNDLGAILKGISDGLGVTNSRHEWISVQGVSGTATAHSSNANMANTLLGASEAIGSAHFNFHIPTNFSSLTKLEAVFTAGENGNARITIETDFGAEGESFNANSDSIAEATIAMTNGINLFLDVTAAVTSIAADDVVGLELRREGDDALDTITGLIVWGLWMEYTIA